MSSKKMVIVVLETPRLLLTIEEAALYLRVSERTVARLIKNKQLSYTRVRESLRFRLSYLNEYLDKRTVRAT